MRRVHGSIFPGEATGADLEFFTVRTSLDIRPTGLMYDYTSGGLDMPSFPYRAPSGIVYADEEEYQEGRMSQRRFEQMINMISLRAQPIVIGEVTTEEEGGADADDLPAAADDGNVYSFKFVVEHAYVWNAEDLAVMLNGIEGFVYNLGDTADNNVAVYREGFQTSAFKHFVS